MDQVKVGQNIEQEVLTSSGYVMVDFWAPWCGYCRRLSPAVDRLAEKWDGKLKVVKINVDEHAKFSEAYEIDTIPTLVLFRDGEAVSSVVNPATQDAMEAWLKENGAL